MTLTEKDFWTNPYLTRLDTHITRVEAETVQVARSIFYAASGGQESDEGSIGGHRVIEARKDGLDLIYSLDSTEGLEPGTPVTIEIDGARRLALMRLHFAAELTLELVYRQVAGIEKIGAHIASDKARIDFLHDGNIAVLFPALLPEVERIIAADLPIESAFSDVESQRRYWQIEGFARVPCGGTHPGRSGEVGAIALKRKNIGKGKERIEITLASPPR
jgi:Ser-tRNA(Ala) deacylase AlaX